MNREIKEVKTPGGHTVEIYDYLTGKEARELQNIVLKHARYEGEGAGAKLTGFDATAMNEAEKFAIGTLVVSLNGNKEKAAEAVENMPLADYRAVVKAMSETISQALQPSDFLAQPSTS